MNNLAGFHTCTTSAEACGWRGCMTTSLSNSAAALTTRKATNILFCVIMVGLYCLFTMFAESIQLKLSIPTSYLSVFTSAPCSSSLEAMPSASYCTARSKAVHPCNMPTPEHRTVWLWLGLCSLAFDWQSVHLGCQHMLADDMIVPNALNSDRLSSSKKVKRKIQQRD